MTPRWIMALSLLCVLADAAMAAPQATKPQLKICVNQVTGVTRAKARCGRNEKPLTVPLASTTGVAGLNVYDKKGKLLGPLVGLNSTIIEIGGAKYGVAFDGDGQVTPGADVIYFDAPGCAGKAYASGHRSSGIYDQVGAFAFSGFGTAAVGFPYQTLYLAKPPRIESIVAASQSSPHGSCHDCDPYPPPCYPCVERPEGRCTEFPMGHVISGYALAPVGQLNEVLPQPFDVR